MPLSQMTLREINERYHESDLSLLAIAMDVDRHPAHSQFRRVEYVCERDRACEVPINTHPLLSVHSFLLLTKHSFGGARYITEFRKKCGRRTRETRAGGDFVRTQDPESAGIRRQPVVICRRETSRESTS
jgi:hypothetical protein